MKNITIWQSAMAEDEHTALQTACANTKYLGQSPLTGTFSKTRGFAIRVTSDGIDKFLQRFRFLHGFWHLTGNHARAAKALPWRQRRAFRPNAFYINLLVIPPGEEVGRHVDGTLGPHCDVVGLRPRVVSVYYLQVPSDPKSGHLALHGPNDRARRIRPREGSYLVFNGDLAHGVDPVQGHRARISLVCEHYELPDDAMRRMRPFAVEAHGAFASVLKHVQHRSLRKRSNSTHHDRVPDDN